MVTIGKLPYEEEERECMPFMQLNEQCRILPRCGCAGTGTCAVAEFMVWFACPGCASNQFEPLVGCVGDSYVKVW